MKTVYQADGPKGEASVVLDNGYFILWVNGEEVTSVHEDEPNAERGLIEEAQAQIGADTDD